jgi:hypothetical protein
MDADAIRAPSFRAQHGVWGRALFTDPRPFAELAPRSLRRRARQGNARRASWPSSPFGHKGNCDCVAAR